MNDAGADPMLPHFDLEEIEGLTVVKPVGPELSPEAGEPLYSLVLKQA